VARRRTLLKGTAAAVYQPVYQSQGPSKGVVRSPGGNLTPMAGASAPPVAPKAPPAQVLPDAQYLTWAAQRQFEIGNQQQQINAAHAADLKNTQIALQRMGQNLPDQRQAAKVSANKQGLFYSGMLGRNLNLIQRDYTRQTGDTQRAYDTRETARIAARQALQQGFTLEQAAQKADAAARQVQRDQDAAAANVLAPTAGLTAPKKGTPKKPAAAARKKAAKRVQGKRIQTKPMQPRRSGVNRRTGKKRRVVVRKRKK
jgi:hypothetical protein